MEPPDYGLELVFVQFSHSKTVKTFLFFLAWVTVIVRGAPHS